MIVRGTHGKSFISKLNEARLTIVRFITRHNTPFWITESSQVCERRFQINLNSMFGMDLIAIFHVILL